MKYNYIFIFQIKIYLRKNIIYYIILNVYHLKNENRIDIF